MQEQNSRYYTTGEKDAWDLIAYKVFGDEKFTSHLFQENPDLLKIVLFPAGIKIKIPDLNKDLDAGGPPWLD